jgi:PAS domain S-box-containing protein
MPSEAGGLADRALTGPMDPVPGGVVDYRGEEVWAATRDIDETGWGLVVKVDRQEGRQPALEFNAWLRQTAIILSAFAIVIGLVLALRFALPIHALAAVANRIRGGELQARADVAREDEVGLLARTFNERADEIERRIAQLHDFKKFFDVTIDLMCLAGTDGFFKRLNPAFQRELGWTEQELLGRPFLDFVHPEDIEKTLQEISKLAEGIPTISFENRYRCKDGGYKLLRWTSHPEGDVLYAIAHVVDPAKAT